MIRILVLLAWLVGPPIFSFLVASGVEYKFDSQVRAAFVEKAATPEDKEKAGQITLRGLCSIPEIRAKLGDTCSTSDTLGWMKLSSVLVSMIAVLLIGAIWLAGVLSSKSRTALLVFFSPGLYITVALTSIFVIVNAGLLIGSIWYGESALIGRVHIGLMACLGIGAFLGVLSMVRACFKALGRATSRVLGKKLSEKEAPELWQYVKELAAKLKACPPHHIVVGLDPNFYVTEANVVCLDGILTGRTLYLSLPLCRILSKDELTAVVGHEFGHFVGQDTKFSLRFYPIYRGAIDALISLEPQATPGKKEGSGSAAMMLAVLPVRLILSYFLEAFATAEKGIGRERELAADKIGAQLGGAANIAGALVKIHAFTPFWLGMDGFMKEKLSQGLSIVNASSLYAQVVGQNSTREALKELDQVTMAHPTDSHPPLVERLKSLSVTLESVAEAALKTQPSEPAISLVKKHEEVEKSLSEVKQIIMVRSGEVTLPPDEGAGQTAEEKKA